LFPFKFFAKPSLKKFLNDFFLNKVVPPPAVGAYNERPSKPTAFRKFYLRGDFPIALEHDTKGNKIAWKVIVSFIYLDKSSV
jgi:hypothetical protein